jgi:hypothetical protein
MATMTSLVLPLERPWKDDQSGHPIIDLLDITQEGIHIPDRYIIHPSIATKYLNLYVRLDPATPTTFLVKTSVESFRNEGSISSTRTQTSVRSLMEINQLNPQPPPTGTKAAETTMSHQRMTRQVLRP